MLQPTAFLRQMLRCGHASPCTLMIGLMYLQRLKNQGPESTYLTKYNYQRLLLTAVMVASKMFDDDHVSNREWAMIGDLSVKELNKLELDLLYALRFECNVTREEYELCCKLLEDHDATHRHSKQRSSRARFCSY
jgi:hypothetical protein